MPFVQQGFVVAAEGGASNDAATTAFAAKATTMSAANTKIVNDAVLMLKGRPGYWEQLSAERWTGTVNLVPMQGDYQLMPARGAAYTTWFDIKGNKDLTVTGIIGAQRQAKFTGTEYATASGQVLTAAPCAAIFIGNMNSAGGSQRVGLAQGSAGSGRTNIINFNTNDGQLLTFYNDGASEQAGSGSVDVLNETRIFSMRNAGGGGASALTVYLDGQATPGITADTGRTYAVENANFSIARTSAGGLPFVGNGVLEWVFQGDISEADLARIGRNFNRIFRLGVYNGGFNRPLPNGEPRSQFAVQAPTGNTTTHFLGSPAVLKDGSEIIVTHDTFGTGPAANTTKVFASTDGGLTWTLRATLAACFWMKLIKKPGDPVGTFYGHGTTGNNGLPIIKKTTDGGVNWTSTTIIGTGNYHTAPVPVLFKGGNMYVAFEQVTTGSRPNQVFVFKIPVASDWMVAGNWVQSNLVNSTVYDPIFGINLGNGQESLEHNILEAPDGSIVLRGRISQTGTNAYYSTWTYDPTGSGTLTPVSMVLQVFGWCKFYIVRDPVTLKYLAFGNQNYNSTEDDRTKLCCYVSTDLVTWTLAPRNSTILDLGTINYLVEGISYPTAIIDGNDIHMVARLGFNGAANGHDTNRGDYWFFPNYRSYFGL